MTKEEVYETEKAAGVNLVEGEIYEYEWKGEIAGQENAELFLSIYDGLEKVTYSFNSLENYDTLNSGLLTKYGDTPYSSETGAYLYEPQFNGKENHGMFVETISDSKYSQWLIPYSDTQSIFIKHYAYQRDRVALMKGFDSFSRVEHVISYELLSEYMTNQYKNPYSGDL